MPTANLIATAGPLLFGAVPPRAIAPVIKYRTYTGTAAAGVYTATQYLTDGNPGNTSTNCHGSAPGVDDISTSFGPAITLSLQALYDFALNGTPTAYLLSATLVANANSGGSPVGAIVDSYLLEWSTDGGTSFIQAATGNFALNGFTPVTASPTAQPGLFPVTQARVTLSLTRPNVGSPPLGLNLTDFRLWFSPLNPTNVSAGGAGIVFGGTASQSTTATAAITACTCCHYDYGHAANCQNFAITSGCAGNVFAIIKGRG